MKYRLIIICTWLFTIATFTSQSNLASSQLTNLYKETKSSVVSIEAIDSDKNTISTGSGFYIDDGGYVVTNYHVVKQANTFKIINSNGVENNIRHVSYISKKRDIIIIALYETGVPLGVAQKLPEIGESVVTIGNPRGFESTLSTGIVSGIRNIDGVTLIQTTTPISPGSSGGPLMNQDGDVVGITTFYLKESQNVNFAVSITGLESLSYGRRGIDYLSPVSVAKAFFDEMSNNNLEAAINYVWPEDQENFLEALRKEDFPDIPKDAQMFGRILGHEKNGLPSAEVGFTGLSLGVDMVMQFNRWWVAK